MTLITIYHDTTDAPGLWVARRFHVGVGGLVMDDEPLAVEESYEALMGQLEVDDLHRLPRAPEDSPGIVETWL